MKPLIKPILYLVVFLIAITGVFLYSSNRKISTHSKENKIFLTFRYNMSPKEFDQEVDILIEKGLLERQYILDNKFNIIYKMNLKTLDDIAIFKLEPNLIDNHLCSIKLSLMPDFSNNLKEDFIEHILKLYISKYGKYIKQEFSDNYYGKGFNFKWTLKNNQLQILKSYETKEFQFDKQLFNSSILSSFSIEYSANRYIQHLKVEEDSLEHDFNTKAERTLKDL